MAPTLEDQDRLIVNKLELPHRRAAARRHRDALLPGRPQQVVREARDRGGRRPGAHRRRPGVRERRAAQRRLRAGRVSQPRRLGPEGDSARLLLRDGRPPEQQLRQPALGLRAEEIHHRQGADSLVAGARRRGSSSSPFIREPARRSVYVGLPGSRPRAGAEPRRRAREDRVRLHERRDQHSLRRLPLPDRRRGKRDRPRRRRGPRDARPTTTIPTATASTRPSRRPPSRSSSSSSCSRCCGTRSTISGAGRRRRRSRSAASS